MGAAKCVDVTWHGVRGLLPPPLFSRNYSELKRASKPKQKSEDVSQPAYITASHNTHMAARRKSDYTRATVGGPDA